MRTEAKQFIQVDRSISRATHYTSLVTGEPVEFNQNKKAIYNLMFDRWEFFKSQNLEYFDTQAYIANETAMSEKTVNRIIKEFTDHGVFVVYSKRNELTHKKLVYQVIHKLSLVLPEATKPNGNGLPFKAPVRPVEAPKPVPARAAAARPVEESTLDPWDELLFE